MEKAKTKYILRDSDQKIRDKILKLIDKPIKAQRYLYFNEGGACNYYGVVVAEKEDRISIISKTWCTMFGNNGMFIKPGNIKLGITYYKTGRCSQRLRIWGKDDSLRHNNHPGHSHSKHELLTILAKELEVDSAIALVEDAVVSQVATEGMFGSIMAGKITNRTEAMQYYIRYSLRGLGIKQENADNMYKLLDAFSANIFHIGKVLRTAKDPNSVVEQFHLFENQTKDQTEFDIDLGLPGNNLRETSHRLSQMALPLGEKIDWTDLHFDAKAEAERLSKKERWTKDMLLLWDGGPVLKASNRSVMLANDLPF